MVRGFEDRRYSLFLVPVLSYVYKNTLFQRGYFYVGLRGAGWYFLPENPTFFVRRNRKIPHTQHTTKIKHANHGDVRHCLFCRPWLSAARSSAAQRLPVSLSQGSAPGFACAVADSRVWGTQMAPTKNWEMGGAPVLDCRRLLALHNNQQNDGVGGRGSIGEET